MDIVEKKNKKNVDAWQQKIIQTSQASTLNEFVDAGHAECLSYTCRYYSE